MKRMRTRRCAWLLAEWQFCIFSFFELNSPKDPSEYREQLGPYRVASCQRKAFEFLVSENLRLSRLSPSLELDASRGHQRFRDMLQAFESKWSSCDKNLEAFSRRVVLMFP